MDLQGTTAVVTGASSGIGAQFARTFAARGADVVLVGRRLGALEEVAGEIAAKTGRRTLPITADLAQPHAARALHEGIASAGWTVDSLVNCAGAGLTQPFAETTPADAAMQMQVNMGAVVEATQVFLPELLSSGRGVLINVGSLTGYMPVPNMAIYAAAKSFVIRFTEAIAHEHRRSALRIMVVSPGPTSSEFFARSGTSGDRVRFQTPKQVVDETFTALDRRHRPLSLVAGATNRLTKHVVNFLPTKRTLHMAASTSA